MNERPGHGTNNRGRYVRVNRMTARQKAIDILQELQPGGVTRASTDEAA